MLPSSEVCEAVLTPSVESDDVLPAVSDDILLTVDALCGDFAGIWMIYPRLSAEKGTIFCFGEIWMNPRDPSVVPVCLYQMY